MLFDEQFHHSNVEIVKNILTNNCFPKQIINKYVNRRINVLKCNTNDCLYNSDDNVNSNSGSKRTPSIPLPYVEGVSENIKRSLKNANLNVVYSLPKKLNTLIKRGKDKLSNDVRTNLVYKIDCNDCDATYIGQTKRHLCTRVKEHFNNIKLHVSNHSVISKHKCEFDHEFNWTAPAILHNEKHIKKREIAEMFFIKKHGNAINLQKDTENFTNIYDKILKVI